MMIVVEGKNDAVVEKNETKTGTVPQKEEILVYATVRIENSVNEVFSNGDFKHCFWCQTFEAKHC